MNRGEVMLGSLLVAILTFTILLGILYFLLFDNLLVIVEQLGYDLYPVESQFWLMFIGWFLLLAIRSATKTHKYLRRDNCNHCGKELHR